MSIIGTYNKAVPAVLPTGTAFTPSAGDPRSAVFLRELTCRYLNYVYYVTNAKAAASQQPDNAGADFASKESVDSKLSQKDRKKQCRCFFHKNLPKELIYSASPV